MVFKANGLERIIKVGSINGEGTGRPQTVKMLMVENSKRELILLSILCPVLHIEHHNKLTTTLGGRNYYLNFKEKNHLRSITPLLLPFYYKISPSTQPDCWPKFL